LPTEGSALAFETPDPHSGSHRPKSLMRRHLLAIAVILTVATGCDNVVWGGVEVELNAPPVAENPTPDGENGVDEQAPERELGPILMAGIRDGSRATLSVVGEVHGDSLAPFPNPRFAAQDSARVATLFTEGSDWVLFAEGVRVGRLTADELGTVMETCTPRPAVSGMLELIPEAATAERFLALSADDAAQRDYSEYATHERDYDQGVASLTIAGDVIPRSGAPWPDEGTLAARQDIQAFQMTGVTGQAVAATFLYRDQLAIAPPGQGAYAVFVMGLPSGGAYQEAYAWYRAVDIDGKGAPRYFSHLDWDGDGESEILLDVFGSNRRWYAGLARRGDEWVRTFQDACGSGSSSGE